MIPEQADPRLVCTSCGGPGAHYRITKKGGTSGVALAGARTTVGRLCKSCADERLTAIVDRQRAARKARQA